MTGLKFFLRKSLWAGFSLALLAGVNQSGRADAIDDTNLCYDETIAGDAKQAIAHCSRAIDSGELVEADLIAALVNRGVAYKRTKQFDKAVADYNRALELAPNDAMTLTNRANAQRELGRIDDALRDLNVAVEANPKYAAAYYVRGTIYESMNEPKLALDNFRRAHELAPKNPDFRAKVEAQGAGSAQ
jgi:tetratricopeptide (TPR) repeat protein